MRRSRQIPVLGTQKQIDDVIEGHYRSIIRSWWLDHDDIINTHHKTLDEPTFAVWLRLAVRELADLILDSVENRFIFAENIAHLQQDAIQNAIIRIIIKFMYDE